MRNEWRGNLWMVVQLLMVSVILWYLFISVFALVNMRLRYTGYDVSDIYVGQIKSVDESSPLYQPYDSVHSPYTDFEMLMSQVRANPHVEIAAAGNNVATYLLNNIGRSWMCDSVYYSGNTRYVTPDVIRLYRLESLDGKSTEQLAEVIARGELIISQPDFDVNGYNDPAPFIGKDVCAARDSSVVRHVGALAYGMRRFDYEPQWGVVYHPLPENYVPSQMLIRIRPGHDREFRESFTYVDQRAGNVYISGLKSISSMRDVAQLSDNMRIRNCIIGSVFLLIVIFLGFLGTFWFRTQQRTEEIAVRIVNGATRRDIFRRFIGEGMILLSIATLIALPVEILIVHYDLVSAFIITYNYVTFRSIEIYQSFAAVLAILALLIVAGIWFPARKAMNIDPAYALKDL